MNAFRAVKTCLSQYATMSGRAPRSEFWWWMLFLFLGNTLLNALEGVLGLSAPLGPTLIFIVATIVPTLSVTARRLHDTNWSGWWAASYAVVAPFGLVLGSASEDGAGEIFGGLLLFVFGIGSLVYLVVFIRMFIRGANATNRFGPDPLATRGSDPDSSDETP